MEDDDEEEEYEEDEEEDGSASRQVGLRSRAATRGSAAAICLI